jgi:uncharacterized protein with FMN-binding domain
VTRAPAVVAATALGLGALLAFHPNTKPPQVMTAPATSGGASSSSAASPNSQTFTGAVETNQYGNVQVQITVSNGHLTDVSAVQLPSSDPQSAQINATAGPLLQQQAVAAQGASLDGVSGATYTSTGYEASLATALSEAGIT